MLERIIKVKGGEFVCSTCNTVIPAGETAHTQFHIEVEEAADQPRTELDFALMPNHEPPTFRVILRTAEAVKFNRSQGRHPVITRKECDACDTKVKLATLRRNCFV